MSGVTVGELEKRAQIWLEEDSEDDVVRFRAMETSLGKLTTSKSDISFNHAVKPK